MRKTSLMIVACLWVGAALVSARPAGIVLQGVVVDSKGAPVAARVFIQSADGSEPHAFRTDSQGHFRRVLPRRGLYDVRAEAGGLWSEWQHNVLVKPGVHAEITLKLLRTAPPAPPQ